MAARGAVVSQRPIAYLMEQTLGSITHYQNLRREETAADGVPPRWLPIEFEMTRVPWAVAGSLRARRALTPLLDQVDGLFMHTTTISLLAFDIFRRKPAVLSTDGTPANKRYMRMDYGLAAQGRLAETAKRSVYRQVFRRAAGFVAWSNWAKASFVEDYGCREQDVAVIPPGIHMDEYMPGDRSHVVPRILFVGGDFLRKGGDLLLQVFRKRLRGRAELVLVTRDATAQEPGVTVHSDVVANSPKLRELYATCDIFALPTRADCYSVAGMEALAAGMPLVMTHVGGIPDIIRSGETGFLVAPDDGAGLGDALELLVTDTSKRLAMGKAARQEALHRYDARKNARQLFEFVRSRC
jgi:glycosyltransferase involved in cell wall biosynthesis